MKHNYLNNTHETQLFSCFIEGGFQFSNRSTNSSILLVSWPQHILTDCQPEFSNFNNLTDCQPEFSNFNTITIYMNVKNHLKDLICSDKQA